ncbi:MAG: hypothetical protein QXY49_01090 [Thermofilaceae archaeon]
MNTNRLTPYEVGRFIYLPGKKPYLYHLLLKENTLSATGILEEITSVFAKRKIPILSLKVSMAPALKIIIAVDLTGKEHQAEELAAQFKGKTYVQDIQYSPPLFEGVAIDQYSFPLFIAGNRTLLFEKAVYEGMLKIGWERFGTPYAILLYLAGFGAGKLAYESQTTLTRDPGLQLKFAVAYFQMLGFGRLEILKIDDKRMEAEFRVYDSFECEVFSGVGERRGNFVRGLTAGWLAGRWGITDPDKMIARERKCIAKGDPYCEYRVQVEK